MSGAAVTWADAGSAVAQMVQAVALLVGGTFAYIKFARGRVLHARLELDVQVEQVAVDGASSLRVIASVTNAGSLRVTFTPDCHQHLTVRLADRELWGDAVAHGELLWSEGVACSDQGLLTSEGVTEFGISLEPGERLHRSLLVPLPQGDWVACRVAMHIEGRPKHIWRTGKASTWKTELVTAKAQ